MDLTPNEIRWLMQGLIHLQIGIARRSEHICSEQEAEDLKVRLYEEMYRLENA